LNDRGQFFAEFSKNSESQKKGEFETTQEHEERIKNLDQALGVFSSTVIYALTPHKYSPFTYEADEGRFQPRSGNPYCYDLHFNFERNGTACRIGTVVDKQDDYLGRNAFGTSANVTSEVGRDLYFVINKRSKVIKHANYGDVLKGDCPIPREEAQPLSGHVDMAYLVRLTDVQIMQGGLEFKDATVASPREQRLSREGLPVEIVGYACYDDRNQEVFHTTMF